MSTQIQVLPKSGITIGTTPITSGTNTRILFQNGGVVSQSDKITFNDTGVENSTTANFANTFKRTGNSFSIFNASTYESITSNGSGLYVKSSYQIGYTTGNNHNFQIGTGAPVSAMYINSSLNVGIGTTSPAARLDVQAQGALSTDIAFRVRNSADTANFVSVQGDGSSAFGTYTNPNTRLTVTGTTFGAYISGNTGIYAQSNITSGTLYAIDCNGRALSGANTSFGIRATSDTSGVGSTNFGGRFNAYNGATNYAGYFDATGGTNNYGIYIQRGDMVFGVSPTLNKIGFWNATPIIQPTTAIAAAALLTNAGTNLTNTDTFDGYTMQQVVKALRNCGILA